MIVKEEAKANAEHKMIIQTPLQINPLAATACSPKSTHLTSSRSVQQQIYRHVVDADQS